MFTEAEVRLDVGAALSAIEQFSPQASRRASHTLDVVVARWSASRDGPHRGRLIGGGFPAEIVFTTYDPGVVRYTCDVAGPALAPHDRLRAAESLLQELGVTRRFPFAALQRGDGLKWGAWLGGRHSASADAYKLYVEAPRSLSDPAREEVLAAIDPHGLLLDSHEHTLRFVGCDTASGDLELYFRGRGLDPQHLGGLMRYAGFGDREDELLTLLDEAADGPARLRLPGSQHGFSISLSPGRGIGAFSFFTFATSMFGDDAMTRRKLLALAARREWNFDTYAAVTRPLAERHTADGHHGIVSCIVPRHGAPGIAVGVRPSWSSNDQP